MTIKYKSCHYVNIDYTAHILSTLVPWYVSLVFDFQKLLVKFH